MRIGTLAFFILGLGIGAIVAIWTPAPHRLAATIGFAFGTLGILFECLCYGLDEIGKRK